MAYNYESQKKYNNKCKRMQIKYGISDYTDYEALEKYLSDNNISFNAYCKQLIRKDLESKGLLDN